jgi:hypothetical protein
LDLDAEFLVQLADQRGTERLARLDLASRELPVTFVDLSGRALRQQERAVAALHDGRRNFDHHLFGGWRPTQSRANW